eukprot:scaffold67892_cov48-Phaeocystis_antarctica.AAC.3
MLIDERRHRQQHSPTFDERLMYGDTDPNLRHNINVIPPLPMRRAAAAIGRSWRLGRLLLPLPLPSLPPRFVGAFPYPAPHVDRHLSGSAALVRLSRRPKPLLHPLHPHVGKGFRHTQIAGWGRASSRRRLYPVTHPLMRAQLV